MDKDIAEKAYRLGFEYTKNNGNCAQCVFACVLDSFGWKGDEAFKCASGLAGGIGLYGDGACGAYSGGVMALSFKYGRERKNFSDRKASAKSLDLPKDLHEKFIQEYGSVVCRDVQKKIFGRSFNLRDPREREEFIKAGGYEYKCPEVVGKAARCTVETLLENG